LEIVDACGEEVNTPHLLTINHLTLNHACSLDFSIAEKVKMANLTSLEIIENDAIDHFITMHEETCLTRNLTSLKIQSTNGCDYSRQWEPEDFGRVLKQCTSLRSLDLALTTEHHGEPEEKSYLHAFCESLPPNVETLRFRGPPCLADDLSQWTACLHSTSWLPHLKTISFRLDVNPETSSSRSVPTSSIDGEELATVRRRNLDDLLGGLGRRPGITLEGFDI